MAFNDYPLGHLSDGGTGGTSASASAGTSGTAVSAGTGGDPPAMPSAGNSNGGTSSGGVTAGGGDVGGSTPIDSGGAAEQAGGSPEQIGGSPTEMNPYLIDDFEDGDADIFEAQGRKGSWFVSNDGTGSQAPDATEPVLPSVFMVVREGSTRGMHTSGTQFDSGAVLGTTLATAGGEPAPYDLSGFQGIRLWVRSNSMSPMAAKEVRLNLPIAATSKGGGCTICGDHFGASIPLTSKWVQVEVPFAGLKQSGFGRPQLTRLDLKAVTSLEFQLPRNLSFDLWLDDIELY